MRVVLDTSVLVAGLLSGKGAAAEVVEHVFRGTLVALFDQRMLDEYREVLARPEFAAIDPEELSALLFVLSQGEPVAAAPYAGTLVDEDDRPFIEVALSGGADVVLTHNPKDFQEPPGLPVMKPGEWTKRVSHWLTKPNPEGTSMQAMACPNCGTVRIWRVLGYEVPSEPFQLGLPCAHPTGADPGARCGGTLWSYEDTEDGRTKARAQGLPTRRA